MVHVGDYWKTGFIVQGVWAVVAGLLVFTRLTTRYYLGTDRLGYDDWLLLTAWILFAIRGICVMASYFPMIWGYSILEYYMSPDYWIGYRAELLFGLGLFVGSLEDGLIRVAIGAFLHKIILLVVIIPTMLFCIAMAIVFLEFCYRVARHPFTMALVEDTATAPGKGYFVWGVLVDFFLALFPWYLLHKVHMKKSKKLVICCSLSLGLIAAALGIVKLEALLTWTTESGEDVMYLYIFSCSEKGVLYICICLPALLPLWTREQEKRRRKRKDAELAAADFRRGIRRKGDSVIHDPRMEELLVETVPTRHGQTTMGTGISNPAELEKGASKTTNTTTATEGTNTSMSA
ncbi:hypothetical protein QBC37DRAFT_446515 [Rhypophila decipiens]|uniref:Rhodopsin domain-containing protein n=1 Tax=Rhypophila decipiens TaxID=261697 RepID=A0AAN6Y345_9PEZI|nr:hypothetical protein QBC37DRAFT_446515 [Rhypophila decipiens]